MLQKKSMSNTDHALYSIFSENINFTWQTTVCDAGPAWTTISSAGHRHLAINHHLWRWPMDTVYDTAQWTTVGSQTTVY